MPFDSIVRVSFQSRAEANQAVNLALVGHAQRGRGSGPFERIGTAAYSCSDAGELEVAKAISGLFTALTQHAGKIDFISVTVAHKALIRYRRVAQKERIRYRRVNRN